MRGLIVVGSFLAIALLLIGFIPAEFYTSAESRTIEPPPYFESSELINWNFTYIMNITSDSFSKFWGKSEFGHDMNFRAEKLATYNVMWNIHGYTFLGFWTGGHGMEWWNENGINRGKFLKSNVIEEDWNANKSLASYTVRCAHFYMQADIGYNTTAYSSVKAAWNNHDLHIMFGIEWSERGVTWNSWSLISSILFFQPIAGVPYVLSALLAVPIWMCVAYMSFIFALRIVGSVFGGGGA